MAFSMANRLASQHRAMVKTIGTLRTSAPTERSKPTNLASFVAASPGLDEPKHLKPITDLFERIAEGETVRALVSTPPQHGKSLTVLHALVWLLQRDPTKRHAYATYAQQFSRDQSSIAQVVAQHHGLPLRRDTLDRWVTPEGGGVTWTSRGGPLTGKPVDGVLLVDDLLKDREEAYSPVIRKKAMGWLSSVAFTRMHPGASVIVIATRWHPNDPTGELLQQGGYEYVKLPALDPDGVALWPEHRPAPWLAEQKRSMISADWLALYMCEPINAEGARVKREWLRHGEPPDGLQVVMGVDLAISTREGSDYTAAVLLARAPNGTTWVLAAERTRAGFHDVINFVRALAERWRPSVIAIEQVQYQAAVVQELLRKTNLPVRGVRPDRDKLTRFLPLEARYEQCVAKGTMVRTQHGETPIEQIAVGELVWTRKGLRRVLWAGQTGVRATVELRAGNRALRCTPDHPIFTTGRGFARADSLVPSRDTILSWPNQERASDAPSPPHPNGGRDARPVRRNTVGAPVASQSGPTSSSKANATTSNQTATGARAGTAATSYYTAPFGKARMAVSPTGAMSTTWTATPATTLFRIWQRFRQAITELCITLTGASIGKGRSAASADSAACASSPNGQRPGFVPTPVDALGMPTQSAGEGPKDEPVFNLHVEDEPEFFANGILVHNCLVWHAPGLRDYEDELLSFPEGAHDDLVDAAAYAFNSITAPTPGSRRYA